MTRDFRRNETQTIEAIDRKAEILHVVSEKEAMRLAGLMTPHQLWRRVTRRRH